jgi:lipoprotein NlpD
MTGRLHQIAYVALLALWLAGCASPRHRAPVEERGRTPLPAPVVVAPADPASAPAASPAPVVTDAAAAAAFYIVKPGDTLIRIGLESGQNWKDIARWNNLEPPHVIEVGQSLRIVPPGVDPTIVASRGVPPSKVETRPLDAPPPATAPTTPPGGTPAATVPPGATLPGAAKPATPTTASPATGPRELDEDINWGWPATGAVVATFDEARNKGVAITGRPGDPVVAAADGRVVYAGSGLRGYGNLVIVKHNNTYLTAYAHNQALLVKEDQVVRRGQKIAEMGSSDAERVQLHFEIRKQGKPVDPAKLLPPR